MEKLAITGAGGFLGGNIIRATRGHRCERIIAISTREIPGDQTDCPLETVPLDAFLADSISLDEDWTFVNCLFPTSANGFRMADGLDKLFRVIDAARRAGVRRFINVSSQSVYDAQRTEPASEGSALSLDTPYAVGKYCSERYCLKVFEDHLCTNLRMASLVGVGYDQRIANRLIDQVLDGKKIRVTGGMQRYGMLDVRDAAEAIMNMLESPASEWETVYNVGATGSFTLQELAAAVVDACSSYGIEAAYEIVAGEDHRNSAIDAALFMGSFSWSPRYALADSLCTILQDKARARGILLR